MQHCTIRFLAVSAALFLGISSPAIARQRADPASPPPRADSPKVAQDCSLKIGASSPADEPSEDQEVADAVDFDRDLKLLQQRESELVQCITAGDLDESDEGPRGACPGELVMNFEMRHDGEPERDIPIGRLPGTSAFFYESGMTIDADGAPNAYHPENVGLDDLANAGTPGRWEGLAKDADGEPYIQGPDDPFPGFYISCTALSDRTKEHLDPTRFVDASKIPYVVLPGDISRDTGARLGDFAVVTNLRTGRSSYAIFADIGTFGEGSVALAEKLGIWPDARNGGTRGGVLYLVFPGSGNRQPRPIEEINDETEKQLQVWGGMEQLNSCAADQVPQFGTEARNRRPASTTASN